MPVCCVVRCGARKNKNQPQLTIHRFPKNDSTRKKWLEAIGEGNINPRHKDWYLCSLHFKESCFNRTLDVIRLRDDSVPTLFSAHQQPGSSVLCDTGNIGNIDVPSTSAALPQLHCENVVPNETIYKKFHDSPPVPVSKEAEATCSSRLTPKEPEIAEDYLITEDASLSDEAEDDPCSGRYSAVGPTNTEEVPSPTQEALFSWEQESDVVPCDDGAGRGESPADAPPPPARESGAEEEAARDHADYRCNFCSATITGFRYTCVQCLDVDLCGACEARQAHATHYVLRIPGPRPLAEVAARLRTVRRALLADAIVHVAPHDQSATEIKEEFDEIDPIDVDPEPEGGEEGATTPDDYRDPPPSPPAVLISPTLPTPPPTVPTPPPTVPTVPTPPPTVPTLPTPSTEPTQSAVVGGLKRRAVWVPPPASLRRPLILSKTSRGKILVPLIRPLQFEPKQVRIIGNIAPSSSFYLNLRNQSVKPMLHPTHRVTGIEPVPSSTMHQPGSTVRKKYKLDQVSEVKK